ncbi:MAG TPA: hypothetical protein DGR97_11290 [Gammaproteobacteria bacterium]|nr:hypothetical protein [Gammaproteobacteria bacterium]|tara:strand:+ start:309 stop:902 length:594 start_codon:yes stop_codon:yes gene_type:complete
MARDYKNSGSKRKAKLRSPGSWLSFISGLGIGLVFAIGVYFYRDELPQPEGLIDSKFPPKIDSRDISAGDNFEAQRDLGFPKREFDFYKILPEMEVKVPDWEISRPSRKGDRDLGEGTYVLQVGSFKEHADADRAKAKLALRGIQAKIHRVVINGQDVWYRVHIGPYSEIFDIQEMRTKLIESGNNFILLKIGDATQ